MAMRQLCDSKDKETETTVSRKTLHVPEVAEDDKDLEYQISVSLLDHLVILDVLVLPRFVRPRFARRPNKNETPVSLSQGFLL